MSNPTNSVTMYGLRNCDTVKRARKWLDGQGIAFEFHDFKKDGADSVNLAGWADACGWEALLNRRGTTYRALSDADKADIDRDKALKLMAISPSLIKRPVVEHAGGVLVGFDEASWQAALS